MPVLSVLLPLWVATRTGAPQWVAAVGLGLNTVLVLVAQTAWAGRVRSDAAAVRSSAAGASLLAACALLGAADGGGAVAGTALVLAGVVLLTIGEISAGAATWHAAFRTTPTHLQGQYQGTFGMAASLARILGPSAALPVVLAAGESGWLAVGAVMAGAAAVLALVTRS
jgi:hypothetical protein